GLLCIGGALFFWRGPAAAPPAPVVISAPAAVTVPAAAPAPSFSAGAPMKRVMDLYESESKRVGQIDSDPKATQKRLEESARLLTPEEIRWLAAQARDIKNDPDARFFAAYMLGLSHNVEAVNALEELAVSPVPASRNERIMEQEQALRASAIEGMSLSCKDFPVPVKDGFTDIISRQANEFLRDRSNRGLYACQFGKSIEAQDKEALQKLREK
ncbi:MAG: hypothetical protein ACXVCI_19325, partial [Bdellovibrionota bacterium]